MTLMGIPVSSVVILCAASMGLTAALTLFMAKFLSKYIWVRVIQVVVWVLYLSGGGACLALRLVDPFSPIGLEFTWGLSGFFVFWVFFYFEKFLKTISETDNEKTEMSTEGLIDYSECEFGDAVPSVVETPVPDNHFAADEAAARKAINSIQFFARRDIDEMLEKSQRDFEKKYFA